MYQQIAVALSAVVKGVFVLSTSTIRFFFHSTVFDFVLSLPLMSVHPSFFFLKKKKRSPDMFQLMYFNPWRIL